MQSTHNYFHPHCFEWALLDLHCLVFVIIIQTLHVLMVTLFKIFKARSSMGNRIGVAILWGRMGDLVALSTAGIELLRHVNKAGNSFSIRIFNDFLSTLPSSRISKGEEIFVWWFQWPVVVSHPSPVHHFMVDWLKKLWEWVGLLNEIMKKIGIHVQRRSLPDCCLGLMWWLTDWRNDEIEVALRMK